MLRVIRTCVIRFGLLHLNVHVNVNVHVQAALHPAAQDRGVDLDWLDKCTLNPVGYQRIYKRTGKPIEPDHVGNCIKQAHGNHVVVSEEQVNGTDLKTAQTTQTTQTTQALHATQAIEAEAFMLAKTVAAFINDMSAPRKPKNRTDRLGLPIPAMLGKNLAAGDTETVTPVEPQRSDAGNSNVLYLTTLLAKSRVRRAPEPPAKPAGTATAATAANASAARPRTPGKTVAKSPACKRCWCAPDALSVCAWCAFDVRHESSLVIGSA